MLVVQHCVYEIVVALYSLCTVGHYRSVVLNHFCCCLQTWLGHYGSSIHIAKKSSYRVGANDAQCLSTNFLTHSGASEQHGVKSSPPLRRAG